MKPMTWQKDKTILEMLITFLLNISGLWSNKWEWEMGQGLHHEKWLAHTQIGPGDRSMHIDSDVKTRHHQKFNNFFFTKKILIY